MCSGHVAPAAYFPIPLFTHTLACHAQRGKGKREEGDREDNIFVFVR